MSAETTNPSPFLDVIVVHGSGLIQTEHGLEPSLDGKMRAIAAVQALESGWTKYLLISGGPTKGPSLPPEALVEFDFLSSPSSSFWDERFPLIPNQLIPDPSGVIGLEIESLTTRDNIRMIKRMIDSSGKPEQLGQQRPTTPTDRVIQAIVASIHHENPSKVLSVGFLTNDYHMPYALMLADNFGFRPTAVSAELLLGQRNSGYKERIDAYYLSPEMKRKKLAQRTLRTMLAVDPYAAFQD